MMPDLTAALGRIEERTHTLADVDVVRQALALGSVRRVADDGLSLGRYQRLVAHDVDDESQPLMAALRLCVDAGRVAELLRVRVAAEGFVSVAELAQALGVVLRRVAGVATVYELDLDHLAWADVALARQKPVVIVSEETGTGQTRHA